MLPPAQETVIGSADPVNITVDNVHVYHRDLHPKATNCDAIAVIGHEGNKCVLISCPSIPCAS